MNTNYYKLTINGDLTETSKPKDFKEIQKIVEGDFEVRDFKVKDVNNKFKNITLYMNEDGRRGFVLNPFISNLIKEEPNNKYFIGENKDGDMILGVPIIFGNVLIKTKIDLTKINLKIRKPKLKCKIFKMN